MDNARASTHPLHFTGLKRGAVPHRITVVQGPFHHHRNDLHVPVRVHAKTLARINTVIVDDQKRSKTSPDGIEVIGKTKTMPAIKPTGLAVKTPSTAAKNQVWIATFVGQRIKLGLHYQSRSTRWDIGPRLNQA